MEALWNLEDKLKITTQEAVLVFTCTAFLVGVICTAMAIKRARRRQLVGQEPSETELDGGTKRLGLRSGCGSVKRALMGSVRWSDARKWGERRESSSRSGRERVLPLLVPGRELCSETEVGWGSHNSGAPVWQRPILMGEKCELPRFSGLILYDERGRPVHHSEKGATDHQEITTTVGRTTLRDLL